MRYFYTDPLAAAWMAKHHKFTFAGGDSLRSACEAVGQHGRDMKTIEGAFHIHKNSLHRLEPSIGDVIQHENTWAGQLQLQTLMVVANNLECPVMEQGIDFSGDTMTCLIDDIRAGRPYRDYRIIQRDGKAFHWPECEP